MKGFIAFKCFTQKSSKSLFLFIVQVFQYSNHSGCDVTFRPQIQNGWWNWMSQEWLYFGFENV